MANTGNGQPPKIKKRWRKITAQQAAEAIKEMNGYVSLAAIRAGVGRKTMYRMLERHQVVRDALEDARELMGDLAEQKMAENIGRNDQRAIEFYLSTIHKHRGYVKQHEIRDKTMEDVIAGRGLAQLLEYIHGADWQAPTTNGHMEA